MDYSMIEEVDSQGIHKVYENWPQIAKKAFNDKLKPLNLENIDYIILAGMGGSGTICDILKSILSQTPIHVDVVKGYHLPKTVNSNSLVVVNSVSGDTQEILSVLQESFKKGCKTISFSSGGKIKEFCKQNKLEYRYVEKIHSPRASLPIFLYSLLNVLSSIIPIDKKNIIESIESLENIKHIISNQNLSESNPALQMATWISGIPMIYYPHGLESVAIRFKNSLHENAKLHAAVEDIIEACHNNIVAWEKNSSMIPILIKGYDDHPKTKERWSIIEEFLQKNKIDHNQIESIQGNILTKIITLIYILDYASIYLAIKNRTDPSPIASIDFVKSKLG